MKISVTLNRKLYIDNYKKITLLGTLNFVSGFPSGMSMVHVGIGESHTPKNKSQAVFTLCAVLFNTYKNSS